MADQPQVQPQVSVFVPPRPAAPAAPVHHSAPSPTPVEGRQSNSPVAPWQARWQAGQDQLTAEDPFRRQDVVISKGEDGRLSVRPRGDGQQTGAPSATGGQQTGQQQPQPAAAVTDSGSLKVGEFELSATDIAGLFERASLEKSRAANTPPTASDYSLDLPENFQLPPGVGEFRFALEDPVAAATLGQLKELAFAHKLDQNAMSGLLGLYASHTASDQLRFAEAQKAEIAKLGAAAPTRVDAVNQWLRAQVGDTLAEAMRRSLFTAAQIQGFERIIGNFTSQGVSGSPSAGRDGGDHGPARVSDEVYARMSYAEKQVYAEAHQSYRQSRHTR